MIRYIAIQILFAFAYVLGLFIYPLAYVLRDSRFLIKPLWYFLNDEHLYGDDEWRKRKGLKENFYASYRFNAIRNSHWNLKMSLVPKKGDKYDIKHYKIPTLTWYRLPYENEEDVLLGTQYTTYKVKGTKYFRYSSNKLIWRILWNVQIGASDNRYIFKNRIKWL